MTAFGPLQIGGQPRTTFPYTGPPSVTTGKRTPDEEPTILYLVFPSFGVKTVDLFTYWVIEKGEKDPTLVDSLFNPLVVRGRCGRKFSNLRKKEIPADILKTTRERSGTGLRSQTHSRPVSCERQLGSVVNL